jgi:hypothetical protein
MARKFGHELQVGDVIDVIGGKVRITKLVPYQGPLTDLLPNARIASFDKGVGMTIEADALFTTSSFEAA